MSLKGQIKFAKGQNEFFSILKKRVNTYFEERKISKHANAAMVLKSVILLSAYIIPFILILVAPFTWWIKMSLFLLMGVAKAGVGMCVMHDANHGAYSSNRKVNRWVGYTINLLGGTAFNWKLQHNILHHTYTNIADMDEDIMDRGVLRMHPHTEHHAHYKFQRFYAPAIYAITTLYWAVAKDFHQFKRYTEQGVNSNNAEQNKKTFNMIVLSKIIYFSVFIFIPIFLFAVPWWIVILGFLLMHAVAGIILTVVFQLAHSVEGTDHPLPDENGLINDNWAIHQMKTTVNFARKSRILNWYLGGLNFQVEHHLFPKICHVHYPKLSEIVKATAEEYNVPYLENETFGKALKSHFRLIKKMGIPTLEDAIV